MKDELGNRIKTYYEDRTRIYLPRRTYTIIRIDGKAFHTYTQGLKRPFDQELIDDMNQTTAFLCKNIQGAKMGFVQSDEISIVLTDFDKLTTSAWFDGNVQKMASIAASLATSKFNQLRTLRALKNADYDLTALECRNFEHDVENIKLAHFDGRVFTIPSREETLNYLIWRQQDTTRNSISSVAQSLYSHKELNGKTTDQMQELIFQKGLNWNDFSTGQKRGRIIIKTPKLVLVSNDAYIKAKDKSSFIMKDDKFYVSRNEWTVTYPPIFTKDKEIIRSIIPILL